MSFITTDLPSALDRLDEISRAACNRSLAVFLDYDGTLTPIAGRPELAVLSGKMRETLQTLAARLPVAIVSGRDLREVRSLIALAGLHYAGSHGFEIEGPGGRRETAPEATRFLPALDRLEASLRARLAGVPGALVERKSFSVAVHYRQVREADYPAIETAVREAAECFPELLLGAGKKSHEFQPKLDWDKGRALLRLLEKLGFDKARAFPVFIGDDITDETAFRVIQGWGAGIVVPDRPRPTAAQYSLRGPDEVRRFLDRLAGLLAEQGPE